MQTILNYAICTTDLEVIEAMNFSGGTSYTGSWIDLDAKASYLNNLGLTDTCVSIVIYGGRLQTMSANNSMCSIPADEELKSFFTYNGDSWVSSIEQGSEFFCTAVIRTQTKEEQTAVAASADTAFEIFDGDLSADFQSAYCNFLSSYVQQVSLYTLLTGVTNPGHMPDMKSCVTWALDTFPTLRIDAPAIANFTLTCYASTKNNGPALPSSYWAPLLASLKVLNTANEFLSQLMAAQRAASSLSEAYKYYAYNDATLNTGLPQLNKDITSLKTLVAQMSVDPTSSYSVQQSDYPSLSYGCPEMKVVVSEGYNVGGGGGGQFDDITLMDQSGISAVMQGITLTNLWVSSGDWINEIAPTFASADGSHSWTYAHGRSGPGPIEVTLQPGELISTVILNSLNNQYAACLILGTNLGNFYNFGNPGANGMATTWNSSNGVIFLGFQGRSGDYVDNLGVVQGSIGTVWTGQAPSPQTHATPAQ